MTSNIQAVQESVAHLLEGVAQIATSHRNLADVANWVAEHGSKDILRDVITQDEYTHDVLVKYRGDTYLVYDVT